MTVPTLTSPPTPAPNKFGGDPVAFDDAMQDRLDWQDTNVTEMTTALGWVDTQVSDVASKATTATTQATSATASAAAALVSANNAAADAGAALWVSGTTYALYVIVRSPLNSQTYKRVVAGSGTTDPSLDTTNWTPRLLDVSTTLPATRPTLNLDFANSKAVDGRITFTRASTATRTNASGLVEAVASGVPRIDYDPVTQACKGLLVEEARTNLLTYSEEFGNAAWTKTNITVTANSTTAPDGIVSSADSIIEAAGSSQKYMRTTLATVAAGTYTLSVYAKTYAGTRYLALEFDGGGGETRRAFFDVANGTVTTNYNGAVGSIASVGGGWYRCSVTVTMAGAASSTWLYISNSSSSISGYTGDGTSGLYIWGAQLEAGAFTTSYIPTVASQVTRAADVASMTGANFSSWYRQDEGSFVCDWAQALTTSTADTFGLYRVTGTGGALPIISARVGYSGTRKIRSFAQDTGSVFEYTTDGGTEASSSGRHSLTYAPTNDFATSSSGAAAITDTSGSITDFSCNTLQIGVGTTQLNGHIARIAYYPIKLSTSQLQALTA